MAFITRANKTLGFGHAARCVHLTRLLASRGICSGLYGDFSSEAKAWIREHADIETGSDGDVSRAGVAVIDRLADSADADAVDFAAIRRFQNSDTPIVVILSGTRTPAPEKGVLFVGYQPADDLPSRPDLLWGMDYAPVASGAAEVRGAVARDSNRAFVCLGGHADVGPVRSVVAALSSVPQIDFIDILSSPVIDGGDYAALKGRDDQEIVVHRGVADVLPLLARSGVVIASYGNIVFEALATGAPVCVVGQKRFQCELAERLEARGLCVAAGVAESGREAELAGSIGRTMGMRERLGKNALAAVDGRGLERLAGVISGTLSHG